MEVGMRHVVFSAITLLCVSSMTCWSESKLLSQLGLPQNTRALLVHADDVGMSWSADVASIEAMEKGSVTCGSVMVPCPWLPSTLKACAENPSLDIGLHLTLTSEWELYRWGPVAPISQVPKLLDQQGYLWRSEQQVYQSVGGDIRQVSIEVQAQIDKALGLGMKPTHLDSHMGTLYYREEYFKLACNLALANDLPFMTFAYHADGDWKPEDILPYYTREVADKLDKAGFPLIDKLIMDEKSGKTIEEGFDNYCKTLSDLKPGVTLLILHLGKEGEELEHITSRHWSRDQQYRIFTDPRLAEFIKKENIHLLGWRELKEKVWDQRDKSIKKVF